MTDGLKDQKFCLLRQEVDPLEYCIPILPFPCKLGIPCLPCDLPNTYFLYESNNDFSQTGVKIYDLEEFSTIKERTFCCPSFRSFRIVGTDYNGSQPISSNRSLNLPCFNNINNNNDAGNSKQEMQVDFHGKFIGKIQEPKCCPSFWKGEFSQLLIFDRNDQLLYNIEATLFQPAIFLTLPCGPFSEIKFVITDNYNREVGYIKHLFYGFYNEICSKADQYGIQYPDNATQENKILITMAALFIDYIWFENT